MSQKEILDDRRMSLVLDRLSFELIENHGDFANTVLIGLQPRGVHLLERLARHLKDLAGMDVVCGQLDTTFFRDDFRRKEYPLIPSVTNIEFDIEGKNVVLVDDVLYTGRTVRSGMDALSALGRPAKVELLVLIDRRLRRQVPIQADYVGSRVDTIEGERVSVEWDREGKNSVILYTPEDGKA